MSREVSAGSSNKHVPWMAELVRVVCMPEQPESLKAQQPNAEVRRLRSEEGHAGPSEDLLRRHEQEIRAHQRRLAETERQLERVQQSQTELYDHAPVSHVSLDPDGTIKEINSTGARLLGLSKTSLIGRPFVEFVFKSDQPRFLDHMRQCEMRDHAIVSELSLYAFDGLVPVQLTTEPREIATITGRRTTTQRVCQTAITRLAERHKVEEELQASEARLKLAQAAGGVGSWDLDLVTRELRWSDEHFLLFGLEPGAVRPCYQVWRQSLHPEDRESLTLAGLCREDVSTVALDYRVIRPDGEVRWLSTRGKVLRDRLGKRVRMIGVTIDVTESKETHWRLAELNEALVSAPTLVI
jgi:PAS domain S-box-containing protein